ncbi:MAG: DUF362 domain-containing protein [Spirochaetales bacterium]|nr:DUF362 domain-containing protein [Spirochaetales bacterium]
MNISRSIVSLIRCSSYEKERVDAAIKKGVDLLGGPASFFKTGEMILVKPNVLFGENPKKCVSTHPAVFDATCRMLLDAGGRLSYGDSSGFGSFKTNMKGAGLFQVAEDLGIPMADFTHGKEVVFSDSPFTRKFTIAEGALACDSIVSLAKLKTHGLLRITGAVKNQFGCIPGLLKPQFHVKLSKPYDFARMLVSLNLLLKPKLYIMDGIMAMEGNGPRGGDPVPMNVLLFSADPVALDAVACRLIDLDPEYVPTNTIGREYGLGTWKADEIEIKGDIPEKLKNRAFRVTRKPIKDVKTVNLPPFFRNAFTARPVIDAERCTRCGTCVSLCPVKPKALKFPAGNNGSPPAYDYEQCIRCYCCQEICPEKAIYIKRPLLSGVFGWG